VNACDLPSEHHSLKCAGMDAEYGGGLVAVEERLDAGSSEGRQVAFRSRRFFLVRHEVPPVHALKVTRGGRTSPMNFKKSLMTPAHKGFVTLPAAHLARGSVTEGRGIKFDNAC
jgi:hypothetical protein